MYFILEDDLILNGQINSEGYCFNSMSEYFFVYKVHATCPSLEILPFLTQLNSRVQQQLCSLLHLLTAPGSPKLFHSSFFFVVFAPFLAPFFFPPSGSRAGEEKQTHLEPREKGMNLAC